MVACRPCRRCTRRGGLPSLSPAYPAFSLLPCPLSPYPPSPAGKGGTKVISCKGLRPLHPQHLTACGTYSPCRTGTPTGWRAFFNPDSRRPGGCQRSIQRRKNRFSTSKTSAASRPALGDARGEVPCIRKQKISPFPGGEERSASAGGGWGRQSKLKAGQAGDKEGKPPRRGRQGQVERPQEGKCVNYPSNRNSSI